MSETDKCQNCKEPVDVGLHTCPYRADVNNDSETLCNCCEKCAYQCAMDI